MSNLGRSCHKLEPFLLTVNAYQPFVNENYLHVQCVILYQSYVIVEKEFVQKERNILKSFKSHVFTIEPYHLNFENVNAVNAVPSISVGSTKNSFLDYPIM